MRVNVMKKIEYTKLLQLAKESQNFSYSPYSNFCVGSAILFENGQIVTGCNVENSSYGLSLCAERNAMTTAVTKGLNKPIAIAIVGKPGVPCAPCGACRQFLVEFNYEMDVVLENGLDFKVYKLSTLLPDHFVYKTE